MSAGARLAFAILGSGVLAASVAALVLGRGEVPVATYLVHASEGRALPAAGVVETPRGERVRLRFERVASEGELVERVGEASGVVLDAGTYGQVSRDTLREWRFAGVVLVVYGVDPAQVAAELEVEIPTAPSSMDVNSFVLLGGTDSIVGDPSSIDRERTFVGVSYRPPSEEEMELGRLGWFQDEDGQLRSWLGQWGLEGAREYGDRLD